MSASADREELDAGQMRRALALAERGRGTTSPNPMVGCVVVAEGEVVGEGWHERPGEAHAEVSALAQAGERTAGATVYVTLEPCAHHGRTPPCVEALIAAGVETVVYGADEVNPEAAGGARQLREAGIDVRAGVLAEATRAQNEVFFHVVERGRPFVTVKLAQSLDGRVAARDGSSQWITSPEARTAGHALRADADAVMVGSGTVLSDDPALTVRHVSAPRGQPRAVVVDARGRTPADALAVHEGTTVVTTAASSREWRKELGERGAEVVTTDPGEGGGVDLDAALAALLERRIRHVLVEGGPTLVGALDRADRIDRLVVHVAPVVLGADGLPSIGQPGPETIADARRWRILSSEQIGPDVALDLRPAWRTSG